MILLWHLFLISMSKIFNILVSVIKHDLYGGGWQGIDVSFSKHRYSTQWLAVLDLGSLLLSKDQILMW